MQSSAPNPPTVAVIGAGAAGLGAAWLLARGGYSVTLFESRETAGGHAYTLDLPIPGNDHGATVAVDAGFIVYNARTYPDLVSLFQLLGVEEENSSMSFAASIKLPGRDKYFEWGSDNLATLFADRENVYRPAVYTMLYDMKRFNNAVYDFMEKLEKVPDFKDKDISLGEFLDNGNYSSVFTRCYLIPMVSAVWSASFTASLAFPARSLFHFFVNHGLAQVFARPQWRTPSGRSRQYVNKVLNDIRQHSGIVLLDTPVTKVVRGTEFVTVYTKGYDPKSFDDVVFATHAPDTLALLGEDATDDERRILGAFKYADNRAYIHSDENLMPNQKAVWSSWNFIGRPKVKPSMKIVNDAARTEDERRNMSSEFVDAACNLEEQPTQENKLSTESLETAQEQNTVTESIGNVQEDDDQDNANSVMDDDEPVCVSYWLNRLQNFHKLKHPVPDLFLTLNPITPIQPNKILRELTLAHPQFTEEAVRAQPLLEEIIQGKKRTWFCGAYARFGFHEDAMMMGLNVAERLSGYKVIRPWKEKNCMAINNNCRLYEMPYSPLRSPLLVYLLCLLVLNLVLERLRQGLGKIAARMAEDDPIVSVAVGDGRLHRFGPARSHAKTRALLARSSRSPLESATLTVKSPRVLARITEALRQGHALAPMAAAAFAAAEYDCPSPKDLTVILKSLFIADGLDLDPSNARKGRAKFAENLLFALVGGFQKVETLPTISRLSELTTCISNVVYPSWWLEIDRESVGVDGNSALPTSSMISPRDQRDSVRILELLGDLSETTIAILQRNKESKATLVLQSEERCIFVHRKADLLFVGAQIEVVLIDGFIRAIKEQMETISSSGPESEDASEISASRFDMIFSPALPNNFSAAGFKSLRESLSFVRELAGPDAIIELGGAAYGSKPCTDPKRRSLRADNFFSGDKGYEICQTHNFLHQAEQAGLEVQRLVFMDAEEAAMDVNEVIHRVYNSLGKEKLEPLELRAVLSQMCMWEAALTMKHVRRMTASFKLTTSALRI